MPGTRPAFARPLTQARRARPSAAPGFTLVELLTVIVIITILMSITMTVSKAVTSKQTMVKAQTDMQAICNALEQFKKDNGEYPPMDNDQGTGSPTAEQNLLLALTGRARWTHDTSGQLKWETVKMTTAVNDGSTLSNGEKYTWGHPYIDSAKFSIDVATDSPSGYKDGAIIHDPWWDGQSGNSGYLYRYKTRNDANNGRVAGNWQSASFLLVSRGPDGQPQDANSNFDGHWKAVNQKGTNTGILEPTYSDPTTNPFLADNLIKGAQETQ